MKSIANSGGKVYGTIEYETIILLDKIMKKETLTLEQLKILSLTNLYCLIVFLIGKEQRSVIDLKLLGGQYSGEYTDSIDNAKWLYDWLFSNNYDSLGDEKAYVHFKLAFV